MSRSPDKIDDFSYIMDIQTRWNDNDIYGHVNNAVYYEYFDTVVNCFLMEKGLLDIDGDTAIGLVVETQCQYFAPLSYPEKIRAGLRVAKLGNSSIRFEIGLFGEDDNVAKAQGHFVHVYVDAASRRPVQIERKNREILQHLLIG